MSQKINHNETLVKINENNELITVVSSNMSKSDFDISDLAKGEKIVSLTELMTVNITSYTKALRNITAGLED